MATTQEDAFKRFSEITTKREPLTDADLADLRVVSGAAYVGGSSQLIATAQLKATIELIVAIKKFDQTSTELISTTNKLTTRIYTLTWVAVGLGALQIILAVVTLFFPRLFASTHSAMFHAVVMVVTP